MRALELLTADVVGPLIGLLRHSQRRPLRVFSLATLLAVVLLAFEDDPRA